MNNGMTPQKLGFFLVLFALAAYVGFYLAVSKAHAAAPTPPQTKSRTAEPELQATVRDYQRLNACANASIRPDIKPEAQEQEAVKCASWGKAVAKVEQLYPYKFGTPVKKGGNEAQNERIAYAWSISKWTDSTAFLNMIAAVTL
jgi:hypothetical protein